MLVVVSMRPYIHRSLGGDKGRSKRLCDKHRAWEGGGVVSANESIDAVGRYAKAFGRLEYSHYALNM